MAYTSQIQPSDRCFSALVAGLEREFGEAAAEGLARIFVAAEDAEFHWDARIRERVLGCYWSLEQEEIALERVAVLGFIDGHFYVAVLLLDAGFAVHGMLGCRDFANEKDAGRAFASMH
ncbi:MAG: hypothetical protein JNM03_17830 [Sphingopyxis sp.]|uniref:hypothetical protein n=1 Tax=Sphingopyxis sp. TaxID=1908224 RepID=UPI001A543A55|nr:hypothetical protein [Sphingopyxis sp.]MBL9071846.1 hypothetical protein [Sphingopyxis sp.]